MASYLWHRIKLGASTEVNAGIWTLSKILVQLGIDEWVE